MPLEEACLFPGQDKFLELKELFVVKFPPFKWNPEKYKDLLYNLTKNPIFTTPWESFTPLLYQRLVVREATLSRFCIDTISVLTIIAVAYIMLRNTADDAMRFIIEQAITFGICIITYIVIHLYRLSHRRRRYKLYKPLVPQWNGDATVMQSINIHLGDERGNSPEERDPVISYMMFGLNSEKCETVALDSLRMENEPWCAVRRELKKNRAESPINFYLLRHADSQLPENMLKMMQLGVRDDFDYLYVDLHCEVKGGRKKYSFTTELKDMRIDFGYRLSSRELECYSAFFGVSPDFLKTLNIGHFTKDFCNMYELRDFFKYRDNYYWSVVRKHNPDNGYTRILMDKSNDMYKEIEKVAVSDGVYHLTFYGKHDILIPKLADFIDHGQNRTRIESLDIYMLQLILARMVHNSKHLMLVKKKPVNIIRHILQPLSANSR